MDEVTWSYIVFVLASLPWISYAFMLMFFTLSLFCGYIMIYLLYYEAGLVISVFAMHDEKKQLKLVFKLSYRKCPFN